MGEDQKIEQDEPDNNLPNSQDDGEPQEELMEEDEEEDDEFDEEGLTSEEVKEIDNKLDALNLVLDQMEQKRDSIHAKLMELLESSREIRQQMKQEMQQNVANGTKQ